MSGKTFMLIIGGLLILASLFILCQTLVQPINKASAQDIPTVGSRFKITWNHPNVADVDYFGLYFVSQFSDDEVYLEVRQWTTTSDSLIYDYQQQSLTAGLWECYMTAFDRAGNESIHSESVQFKVGIDAPFNIQIIRIP